MYTMVGEELRSDGVFSSQPESGPYLFHQIFTLVVNGLSLGGVFSSQTEIGPYLLHHADLSNFMQFKIESFHFVVFLDKFYLDR